MNIQRLEGNILAWTHHVSHRLSGRQFLFSSFDLFSHCMWCAIWGVGLHQDGARKYVSRDSLQRDQSIWDSEDAGCNWKGGWDAPWRDKEDGGGGTSLWSSLHVEVQGRWKSHKQVPSRPTLRVASRCRWCGTQFKELREGLRFFYFLKGDFEPLTEEKESERSWEDENRILLTLWSDYNMICSENFLWWFCVSVAWMLRKGGTKQPLCQISLCSIYPTSSPSLSSLSSSPLRNIHHQLPTISNISKIRKGRTKQSSGLDVYLYKNSLIWGGKHRRC